MGALSSVHVLCCPIRRVNRDQAGVLGGAVQVRGGGGLIIFLIFLWLFFAQMTT